MKATPTEIVFKGIRTDQDGGPVLPVWTDKQLHILPRNYHLYLNNGFKLPVDRKVDAWTARHDRTGIVTSLTCLAAGPEDTGVRYLRVMEYNVDIGLSWAMDLRAFRELLVAVFQQSFSGVNIYTDPLEVVRGS